jgi:hypothetical protein
MTVTAKRIAGVVAVIAANVILFSCSSGPTAPQKGTPAFYWQTAREAYAAGDHMRTIQNLDSIVASENEFTGRARVWLLVMTSGVARGYMEIADFYESGARINKANPLSFHKQVSNARNGASRAALRFAEVIGDYRKSAEESVVLDFPFPSGSPAPSPVLMKVGNGIMPAENEMEVAHKSALTRAVVLSVCRAAGAPADTARAQALFKAGPVKVPRAEFNLAMANALYDQSQLFLPTKLDQPAKMKIFCTEADATLKTVPESKLTKELNGKIQATLKKIKN